MKRSLRRAVSLLCVLAMCLSLLPTTALADGSLEYEAEAFAEIYESNQASSTNDHTVAYAIWTDAESNYYIAVLAMQNVGSSEGTVQSGKSLTVTSDKGGKEIENADAEETLKEVAQKGNQNTAWWIVQLSEDVAKEAFKGTQENYYLDIVIGPHGHELQRINIPDEFVEESGIDDEPGDSDDEDEDVNITPTANPITIEVVVDGVAENKETGASVDSYVKVEVKKDNEENTATDPTWNPGSYENGEVTYSVTFYDCKDIGFSANSGYIIEAIEADLVYGQRGSNGIYESSSESDKKIGDYIADNVQGGSTVTVYVRTVYSVEYYLVDGETTKLLDSEDGGDYADTTQYVAGTTAFTDNVPKKPETDNGQADEGYYHVECDCTTDCPHTGYTDEYGAQKASAARLEVSLKNTIALPDPPEGTTGWYLNNWGDVQNGTYTVSAEDATADHIIKFYARTETGTEPDPGPTTGTLTVTKTVAGLGENGLAQLDDNFAIEVKNSSGTTVATLKYGSGISKNGTDYSTTGTWEISLNAGNYTVTEHGAGVTGYTLQTAGGGSVSLTTVGATVTLTNTYTEIAPTVSAEKSATLPGGQTSVKLGDTITYTIKIQAGTGNQGILKNFSVTDAKFPAQVNGITITQGNTSITDANLSGDTLTFTLDTPLGADEVITITYSYTVTQADVTAEKVTNSATVKAWNNDENKSGEDEDNTTTTVDGAITGIKKTLVASKPDGVTIPAGVTVSYPGSDGTVWLDEDATSVTLLYAITVTGDPGASYTVVDEDATFIGGTTVGSYTGILPAATDGSTTSAFTLYAYKTFEVTNDAKTTPGQEVTNTAAIQGSDTLKDEVKTPVKAKNPAVAITKELTAVNGSAYDGTSKVNVGDTLTYTITVKNTGNTVLTNVEVTDTIKGAGTVYLDSDDKTGNVLITGATATITELKSNNEVKLTATYQVVEADAGNKINNEVVAEADDGTKDDGKTPSVTVEDPKLTVDKTASVDGVEIKSGESVNIGDEITYTITVKNDGNTTFERSP